MWFPCGVFLSLSVLLSPRGLLTGVRWVNVGASHSHFIIVSSVVPRLNRREQLTWIGVFWHVGSMWRISTIVSSVVTQRIVNRSEVSDR